MRRLPSGRGEVFVKTYDYESWADRLRSFGRRTLPFFASRARREFDALSWLRTHGFDTAEPLLVAEWRQWGVLRRAVLITARHPGEPADRQLETLAADRRPALARAIGRFVGALHQLGFRDRNLDLRNLLVHEVDARWHVAKIDSPRHRLVARGRRDDRLAREDWSRLLPQLARWSLADTTRAAATVEA